ncbi:efflux transporter outer membrane subunit [Oxalobacter vibrioformis]|uniref:Efflux transporter outer membrane subunit n=1 Tax=Oxalobacter vibrioformis TaxID=933080 RepID=A0A9E9P2Q4_9BURK|nr:efflux transporter outer membrane subunit [Oxalobacter vibrioformis]WAW09465.1 efflux transporter outer membrane subunit [Oxalobacter vibrioformis]
MTRLRKCAFALMAAGMLTSCSMAPTYERPEAPVEGTWPEHAAVAEGTIPAPEIGWAEFVRDPRLQVLIAAAIENNRDLRVATLRIEEARAQYNIQWSERLPNINAEGQAQRSKTPGSIAGTPGYANTGNYQVGLGLAAFEIDFFGRVKSLSDAALYQYFATEEAQRSAHISLVSEVCKTYLTERALAKQRDLAQKSYKAYKSTYELTEKRFEVGASSALELRQYETLMHNARVSVVTLERQRAQMENALTVLIGGKKIDNLPAQKDFSDNEILMEIPAGLPSDLLANRPDIRQYENQLRSANANIGAARAAFFPRITLTAFGGTASNTLSGLFDAGSSAWTFTPQILLPIFDAGRNIANLDLAEARKNIAITEYEKTIQVAFREVADALIARGLFNEQVTAQAAVLTAESERLMLSRARYDNGIASSLDVLDAERQHFAAEQTLVQARLDRLINTVDLYRSLGGGLQQATVPVEPLAEAKAMPPATEVKPAAEVEPPVEAKAAEETVKSAETPSVPAVEKNGENG